MANKIRGHVVLKYTPSGGTEITMKGRSCKINVNDELIDITELDETNFQIVTVDQEIIKSETTFEIGEIFEVTKDLVDQMFGNNANHTIGLGRSRGTATIELHDRKDAVGTPFLEIASFSCRLEFPSGLEMKMEDVTPTSVNVITEGTTRPTYTVRGVPAA